MTMQLQDQGIRHGRSDDVETLLTEVSGAYNESDNTKADFDHRKTMLGLSATLLTLGGGINSPVLTASKRSSKRGTCVYQAAHLRQETLCDTGQCQRPSDIYKRTKNKETAYR